jgi:hypothetical protein
VEQFGDHPLDALAGRVGEMSSAPSRLHPALPLTGDLDNRWRLRLNTKVEAD